MREFKIMRQLSVTRIRRALMFRVYHIFYLFDYLLSSRGRQVRMKFKNLNKAARDKLIIVASGPSLNHTDMNLLVNHDIMVMNRGWLVSEKFKLKIKYLVCIDTKTHLDQMYEQYENFDSYIHFYNYRRIGKYSKKVNRYFIFTGLSPSFYRNGIFGNGKSVTYTCIQLGYLLGYKKIILIGKDHSYNSYGVPGTSNKINASGSINHFSSQYYKPGDIFDAPDLMGEERAYRIANKFLGKAGIDIVDCTENGQLHIFRKSRLSDEL